MVIVAPGNDGAIVFVPKTADSYWYESFECLTARTQGYNAISFTIQGPSNASVALELQTKQTCADENFTSTYSFISELSGSSQEYTLSLSAFGAEANLDAIVGIVWSQFSSADLVAWTLGNVRLVCGPDIPTGGK
jgi:hypothetical protein